MYDDDRDALAAEYVLGTLSADERDQAEALLVIDPGFAEIVRVWERRLGELNVMVEAVEPPPDVWDRIKTEIDGAERRITAESEATVPAADESLLPTIDEAAPQTAPETATETVAAALPQAEPTPEATAAGTAEQRTQSVPDLLAEPTIDAAAPLPQDFEEQDSEETDAVAALASSLLPPESPQGEAPPTAVSPAASASKGEHSAEVVLLVRQARRWRGLTALMGAIAALLAVYVAIGQLAPGLLPVGRISPSAAVPPPGSRLVAVLQQEPTAPAFLVTVDPQHRTMTVRRMTASADAGRSYELWLIAGNNPKPRSLGLVGAEEFTTRPLPASFNVAEMRGARYAVSLEPAGGSPSGVPTGPVLFTGNMVESVAPAPPPKT